MLKDVNFFDFESPLVKQVQEFRLDSLGLDNYLESRKLKLNLEKVDTGFTEFPSFFLHFMDKRTERKQGTVLPFHLLFLISE